jgi:glycosyltransferase involved in cell wall biosynthesis
LVNSPRVVIAIATKGTRPTLFKTIESVLNQNYDNLILKIVCPKLEITKIKSETADKFSSFSNLEFIIETEIGQSAAINQVFADSISDDFFGWINDDDYLAEGAIARAVKELTKPEVVAVFGYLSYLNKAGKLVGTNRLAGLGFWFSKYGPNLTPQPGSLFKISSVKEIQLLNPQYKFAMDLDLWLRLRDQGRFSFIKQTQAFMLWHEEAATVKQRKEALYEAYLIRKIHSKNIFEKMLINLFWIPTKIIAYLSIKLI